MIEVSNYLHGIPVIADFRADSGRPILEELGNFARQIVILSGKSKLMGWSIWSGCDYKKRLFMVHLRPTPQIKKFMQKLMRRRWHGRIIVICRILEMPQSVLGMKANGNVIAFGLIHLITCLSGSRTMRRTLWRSVMNNSFCNQVAWGKIWRYRNKS